MNHEIEGIKLEIAKLHNKLDIIIGLLESKDPRPPLASFKQVELWLK